MRNVTAWVFAAFVGVAAASSAAIQPDEVVVFFRTCGALAEDEAVWIIPVHGWIYEPEEDSAVRSAIVGLSRRMLGRDLEPDEAAFFERRVRLFLVDNERGKEISVRVGENVLPAGGSGADGHFEGVLRLPRETFPGLFEEEDESVGRLSYQAVTRDGDHRTFEGTARLVGQTGLSVVSDIDDTVKESHVTDRGELLANTFLREFRAVAGMAETYRIWAARGAVVHYVSASPYQLHEPITRFLDSAGFPSGSVHMKRFRWKDSSVANLFAPSAEIKRPAIETLLTAFPGRKFALVGDSGEEDPELYADLARAYPEQVVRVAIRDVTGEGPRSTRFLEAFRGMPRERWVVFREAAELADVLDPYLDTEGRAVDAQPVPPRREDK